MNDFFPWKRNHVYIIFKVLGKESSSSPINFQGISDMLVFEGGVEFPFTTSTTSCDSSHQKKVIEIKTKKHKSKYQNTQDRSKYQNQKKHTSKKKLTPRVFIVVLSLKKWCLSFSSFSFFSSSRLHATSKASFTWSKLVHDKEFRSFLSSWKIWAIYYKSLTWFKGIWSGTPLLNHHLGWPRLRSL